jgi:hypothetical protein
MPGGQRKFTANNNQRHPGQPSVPGLLDTKHAVAHIDQDSWQRYLEAARYRHAAAKPRAGAPSAINAHCDALQNAKFVPVMPSPRMLLPSASADDQTREPIATTSQESSNEHVNSARPSNTHENWDSFWRPSLLQPS